MKYESMADIVGGRFKMRDRQAFETAFANWPDGPVWSTFQSAMVFRSPGQNKYWHAAIVRTLAEHCGVSARQVHEALKVRLIPEIVVVPNPHGGILEEITIGGTTTTLTRNEASNMIDRAVAYLEAIPLNVPHRDFDPVMNSQTDTFLIRPVSHFIPWDSPKLSRRSQRAYCGAVVLSSTHSNAPTCADCLARLAEDSTP